MTSTTLLELAPIALAEIRADGSLGERSARFGVLPGAATAIAARLAGPSDVEGDHSGTTVVDDRVLEVTFGAAPEGARIAVVRDVTDDVTERAAFVAAEHARLAQEQRIGLATHDLRGAIAALQTWTALLQVCAGGRTDRAPASVLDAIQRGSGEVAAAGARLQALSRPT